MKDYLVLIAFAVLLYGCARQSKIADGEIHKKIENYQDLFNAHDASGISKLWSQNGTYLNLSQHERAQGQEEIQHYFAEEFKQNGTLKITVDSIKDEGDDILVIGHAKFNYPDKTEEEKAFKGTFISENGNWVLKKVMEVEYQTAPSHFEELKELNWFTGSWVDEDEFIDITYDWKWDANKNYLTQFFTMKVLDENELSGQQIVGYDAADQKIRSWIFDSDGGFGQGTWEKQGDSWYVTSIFTLSDGRQATATNVYTKIDDQTYTFSSENRDIDGKTLPNIGPFKVVRR